MKELQLTLHGRVQGVFFRTTVQQWAESLHVTGYVQNKRDGSVNVVAQGKLAQLKQLKAYCEKGSPTARVEAIEVLWAAPTEHYTAFEVRA